MFTLVAPELWSDDGLLSGVHHIDLDGEYNMRDLGGYSGYQRKKIRSGKLFRSGELSRLTPSDHERIHELGIKNVIDLRSHEESDERPDCLPEGIRHFHLPLIKKLAWNHTESETIAAILSGQVDARSYMTELYTHTDSMRIVSWRGIFKILESGETTLYHCTAGKDRAGMTTAILLYILGVEQETVVEDFLSSNIYLRNNIDAEITQIERQYGEGIGEVIRPLLEVEETYLRTFYQEIDRQFGGMDQLICHLQIDVDKLRSLYLE